MHELIGLLLIGSAGATALLAALATRRSSLVSTLLVAYLAFVADLGLVILVLSPFREATRGGVAVAEVVLLTGALAAWWSRGTPPPPLTAARTAAREVISDPVAGLFLVFVLLLLAYELVLGNVPSNNGDSLAYHLAKAAAWAQHGGYYWIPDAPTVRMNAFQPLAEQQIMFLFVVTGRAVLFTLPQYLAQLAILVAVYGAARRLGFEVRAAACGAFLLATFSLVALEATTAQNDLVAASFPAVAACLLLGGGVLEPALAGVAAGFGLGTKLTTGLVLPMLAWLALARGRRALAAAVGGGVLGFAALGMWGYVLNAVHTGHLLGVGTGAVEDRAPPSYPGSVANAFYLMYGTMDGSMLSSRLIHILALVGLLAAAGVTAWALRRAAPRRAGLVRSLGNAARVAIPFLAPLLVIGGAGLVAFIARRWGFPIRGPGGIVGPLNENLNEEYTRIANEDFSAFGPVGIVALLAATAITVWAYAMRRADLRHLALASALPGFLILISLQTAWNPFLIRFFLVPGVLAAPLLAGLFRGRATTAAYLVAAAITVGVTITHDQPKPLKSRPWNMSQLQALDANSDHYMAEALADYDQLVPDHACVGAVLDVSEPSFLLFGPGFEHHVVYLPAGNAVESALRSGLFYVVVSTGAHRDVADSFTAAGWKVRPLGGLWLLASEKLAGSGACNA